MMRPKPIWRNEIACLTRDQHSSVRTGSGTNDLVTSGDGLVVFTPRCVDTSNIVYLLYSLDSEDLPALEDFILRDSKRYWSTTSKMSIMLTARHRPFELQALSVTRNVR
ncbi:uncharacterized protein METZ01_LOCUS96562 [marine metagenome]|uniref:Uncharacterized protein n=1 Tax=marine metagenome TaxID=408172 RepID=A0A381VVB5_9ZZZZ